MVDSWQSASRVPLPCTVYRKIGQANCLWWISLVSLARPNFVAHLYSPYKVQSDTEVLSCLLGTWNSDKKSQSSSNSCVDFLQSAILILKSSKNKPLSVFQCEDPIEKNFLKIIDFGLSCKFTPGKVGDSGGMG